MNAQDKAFQEACRELDTAIDCMEEGVALLMRIGNNTLYESSNAPAADELIFLYEKLQEQAALVRKRKQAFWDALMNKLRHSLAEQRAEEAEKGKVFTLRLVGGDGEPAA